MSIRETIRPLIDLKIPYIMCFSLFMICAGLTLPRTSGELWTSSEFASLILFGEDYSLFYYFVLWLAVATSAIAFIMVYGIEYVSWPRLIPPTDIVYYEGPGYRSAHHGKGLKGSFPQKFGLSGKVFSANAVPTARKRALTVSKMEEIEMGNKQRVD